MKNFTRVALSLIGLTIAAWALIYFILHFASSSFQEGAMGNLFATILGVIVGIPIALELSRRQQDGQNAAALTARKTEEAQRKRKVLSLISSELHQNRNDVTICRKPIDTGGKREVHTGSLRDEMWSAFADGGELQHVNDPDLLAAMAGAYYEVRSSIHLERAYLSAIHFPGMRVAQEKYPQDHLLEYLTATDPQLLAAIDKAVATIDSELAKVSTS